MDTTIPSIPESDPPSIEQDRNVMEVTPIVQEIADLQDTLFGAKEVLKGYKIESGNLDELKKKAKILKEEIRQEKDDIEGDFLEHEEYKEAKKTELECKVNLKDRKAELRGRMKLFPDDFATIDVTLKSGDKVKVQAQKTANVFIDGKEQK